MVPVWIDKKISLSYRVTVINVYSSQGNTMQRNGLFVLIPCVLLAWGFSWPFMKLSLNYIPPIAMGSLRMFIGSIVLFCILSLLKIRLIPKRSDWSDIIIIALLQMTLFNLFVNLGLQRSEVSRSVILVFTTPLWVAISMTLFFKEKLHRMALLGLFFGFVGTLILFNPLTYNWHNTRSLVGDSFLILTALSWSASIIYVRRSASKSSPLMLAPWQMLLSAILLACFSSLIEHGQTIHWSWNLALIMLYIGPVATAFGYWGVIEMSRKMQPVNMSLTMLGIPIIGFLSSAYFLKEPLAWPKITALLSLLIGLICVALANRLQKKSSRVTTYEDEPI